MINHKRKSFCLDLINIRHNRNILSLAKISKLPVSEVEKIIEENFAGMLHIFSRKSLKKLKTYDKSPMELQDDIGGWIPTVYLVKSQILHNKY